jgi:hypothetical protein
MMSAPISMTFGTDLGKGNHVFADGGDAQRASFAESFDERTGYSSVAAEKEVGGVAALARQEFRNVKSSPPASIANEMAEVSDVTKGKSTPKQALSGSDEKESAVLGRTPITLINGLVRPQSTIDNGAANLAEADKTIASMESNNDREVPGSAVAVGAKGESLAEDRDIEVGSEPIPLSNEEPSIKNNSLEGKPEPITSAKKTVKAHPPEIAKPSETKSVAVVQHPIVAPAKAEGIDAASSPAVVAVQLNIAEIASTRTLQSESQQAVTGAVKPFASRPAIDGEGSAQRYVTRDAKPVDVESPAISAGGSVAPQQFNVGEEKSSAVMNSTNGDGDKTLSIPAPAMAIVHGMAGGMGIVQGSGPNAFSQSGVQVEGSVSKLQNAENATSGVNPQIGAANPEFFGGMGTSIDGVPHMLTATPTTLEVGIQNGTHGWLKVRAEMADGGGVSASVSAATSAGQEMLHRELPAITAYLLQEKVAVGSVVVQITAAAGPDSRSSSEGMQNGGGQTPQRGNEGGGQPLEKGVPNATDEIATYESLNGVGVDGQLTTATYAVGGSWLSVRA